MPEASRDALVLRSPDALVCALPYLVGFVPARSLVLVWVSQGRLLLTQRMDLPAQAPTSDFMAVMWAHEAADEASELIACIVDPGPHVEALVEALVDKAQEQGVAVRDVLVVAESRWRSLLCADTDCCPREGRAPDPSIQSHVAAEFAVIGVAPRASRAVVEAEISRDDERTRALTPRVIDALAARSTHVREQWRDEVSELITRQLLATSDSGVVGDVDLAAILVGLGDVRVRDTFLWDAMRVDPDALQRALAILQEATRSASDDVIAPTATCAAVLWWVCGDGARALISVERALDADPDYSLGVLVLAALRAGLPPAAWRDAMAGLSREDCRVRRDAA